MDRLPHKGDLIHTVRGKLYFVIGKAHRYAQNISVRVYCFERRRESVYLIHEPDLPNLTLLSELDEDEIP